MLYDNILQAVKNTPLVRLNNLRVKGGAQIYLKLENLCVGGSTKTRTALNMVKFAIKKGYVKRGGTLVECTSGNQGVGLALVGAYLGFKVIIVMPSSVEIERKKLITHYGAKIVEVKNEGDFGKCLNSCFLVAKQIARSTFNCFFVNQFNNSHNYLAHYKSTAQEIIADLNGKIDGLCLGVGSGGSITGIGRAIKKVNKNLLVWAVLPENALTVFGKSFASHLQTGIGDGIIPPILDQKIYSKTVAVSDYNAINSAKMLAKREGIACGISGGSNLFVAMQMAKELGRGKKVVTLLPDNAERYFSTPLFD